MKVNTTALAIIVGFGLVAGAIYMSNTKSVNSGTNAVAQNQPSAVIDAEAKRASNRFVYGNPDAPVTVVEFSDYECPFCARLHPTLERIVDESDGQINWEYRHLPIPSHRNAELASVIGECVGRNVSNEAFWDYTGTVFENQRSVNETFLTDTAVTLGLTTDAIDACKADSDIITQVRDDIETARAFGGGGTPFNVVVFADGSTRPVEGALPYEHWVNVLGL